MTHAMVALSRLLTQVHMWCRHFLRVKNDRLPISMVGVSSYSIDLLSYWPYFPPCFHAGTNAKSRSIMPHLVSHAWHPGCCRVVRNAQKCSSDPLILGLKRVSGLDCADPLPPRRNKSQPLGLPNPYPLHGVGSLTLRCPMKRQWIYHPGAESTRAPTLPGVKVHFQFRTGEPKTHRHHLDRPFRLTQSCFGPLFLLVRNN